MGANEKYAVLDDAGECEMIAAPDMAKEQVSCYEDYGPNRRQRRQTVEPLSILTTGLILGVKCAFEADHYAGGASLMTGLGMVFEAGLINGLFLT